MTNTKPITNAIARALISVPSTLEDFAGRWKLERDIALRNGEKFVFNGEASFTWRESYLVYEESGQVIAPNGNVFLAQRTYLWQQQTKGKFDVLFDDKRYFHTFSSAEPYAQHLCGDDHYVVNYAFEQWPVWTSTWQVKGPKKDYKMHGKYQRA